MTTITKQSENSNLLKQAEFNLFAQWMALPDEEKAALGITTQGQFAEKHNLSQDTLTLWKKRVEFWTRVEFYMKKWGKEYTPNVLKVLYKRAIKMDRANPRDTELWLKYVQQFDSKEIEAAQPQSENVFTEENLNKIIQLLPEHRQAYFYSTIGDILAEARWVSEGKDLEDYNGL